MAKYRAFVEAVQWTGINVIEIRQFVRQNTGYLNNAVIRDGILYLENITIPDTPFPIAVLQTHWVVRNGSMIEVLTPQDFASKYELAV